MSKVLNNQQKEFDNTQLTNLDFTQIIRSAPPDKETSNKKYIDDVLDKNTNLKFNQTLETYLKVSVGGTFHSLLKIDKIIITDTKIMRHFNVGGCVLQQKYNKGNDKIGNDKTQNFLKSPKGCKPTPNSGPSKVPPSGDSF